MGVSMVVPSNHSQMIVVNRATNYGGYHHLCTNHVRQVSNIGDVWNVCVVGAWVSRKALMTKVQYVSKAR